MPGSLISSTTWSLEGEGGTATGAVNDEFDGDRHMSGLTDEEMHQVLFSDQPIKELHPSSGSTTEAIVMPSPETVLNHCNAAGAAAATSFTQQSLVRTASGLSPALEWSMLCEFALMGHPQLPVVDMDMVFLRYTYSLPSPLPTYLVLSLVACGANYSARKVVPGIDVDSAAFLFELAKQEMMMVALKELCVDAISALTLVGFHWQGDLSAYERNCLLDMSVRKVQQLGLHKEPILRQGRSSREAGVVKYLVWLNYIVDAFSCVSRLSVGDIDLTKVPYNGDDIHLTHTCEEDMHAMSRDFFTGAYRPGWNITRVTKSWQYNRAFGTLAKIQNAVRNAQRIGASTHYLHCRLLEWQERYFHDLDIRKYHWEPLTGRFKEFMGMTWAVVSLNFSFWYCSLNIYFDDLRPFLCVNNDQMLPSIDTMAVGLLDESKIRGCFRCFIAMIGIFETLATGNHLLQTSQILRCQLYFGGRVLQIFYRNGVSAGPEYRVDDNLLQRWERCLEICELIWGFSARELDLSSMRLKEL